MRTVPPNHDEAWGFTAYMEKQSALELARRSMLGAPVYSLISLIIFIGTPTFLEYGWWAAAEAVLLVLLGALRVWFARTFEKRYEKLGEKAVFQFNILTALQSLTLGILAAVAIYKYWASHDVVLTIVLSAGCIAAGTSALSVRRSAHVIFLACVLIPLGISLFLIGGLAKALLVTGFLALMAFLVQDGGQARRTNLQLIRDHYNALLQHRRINVESQSKSGFLRQFAEHVRETANDITETIEIVQALDSDRKYASYSKRIGASSGRLLKLIEEFPGSLPEPRHDSTWEDAAGQPMSLRECVYTVVEMYRPEALSKKLELTARLDDLPREDLAFERDYLVQILANLVGNAVKFTLEGAVLLGAKCREPHGNELVIEFSVSDTGKGIPADQLQTIFNPFGPSGAKSSAEWKGTWTIE